MSSGPETRFYRAVHRLLPKGVYAEKMANPYRGGTPDVWYSGNADDLWAEYKWINRIPSRAPIRVHKLLSALQLKWLRERYKEGRNTVVILGSPAGAWIFERCEWEQDLPAALFKERAMSKRDVANAISNRVLIHAESTDIRGESDLTDV